MNRRRCRGLMVAGVALLALALAATAVAAATPNRNLELVSPETKYYGIGSPTGVYGARSSADGDTIFITSDMPLPSDRDGLVHLDSRFDRGSAGWRVTPLVPATESGSVLSTVDGFEARWGVSDDGQTVLYSTARALDLGDQDAVDQFANAVDLYLRQPDGSFEWVTRGTVSTNDPNNSIARGVLSADGSHVVFESAAPLLPEDVGRSGGFGLYDWHDGQLHLVGVDDSGALISANGVDLGGLAWGGGAPHNIGLNAVSRDGRRIFFTADNRAYVRIDGQATESLAPSADPSATQIFQGATPDGSQAFFTTDESLTADDTDGATDLYRYSVAGNSVKRMSVGSNPAAVIDFGIQTSDDGQTVYFEAVGKLTPDAPDDPVARKLYVNDHGTVRYVGQSREVVKPPACDSNWRVTPDGQHLVFATASSLSADDVDQSVDLYEYSLATGTLARVSGDGESGNGPVDAFMGGLSQAFPFNTCQQSFPIPSEPRVISDDGRFVFFQAPEGLVPRDTNGVMDVYQHDLDSGTTTLISGGTGPRESVYIDSGANGRDLFFATFDALVPQDADTLLDVYDARIGGGFPVADSPAPCAGDDCQAPPSGGVPEPVAPGSGAVSGTTPSPPPPAGKPALNVGRISRAQARHAARTGRLKLRIRASLAGRVFVHLRMGPKGHRVSAGAVAIKVAPRTTRIATVAFNGRARRRLGRRHRLLLTVRTVLMPGHVTERMHVRLVARRSRHARAAGLVRFVPNR